MGKEYEKQHIIPQFYLKNFASGSKKNKIAVNVSKEKKPYIYEQSIRNVGIIKNYYSLEDDEDCFYFEKMISSKIEKPMSKAIKRIISNYVMKEEGDDIIDDQLIEELIKYIAFQTLRVPAFYGEQMKKSSQILKKTKKELIRELSFMPKEYKDAIRKIDFKKNDYQKILLSYITNDNILLRISKVLKENFYWFAFINSLYKQIPFITSDNPVVVNNYVSGQIGIVNGLNNSNTVISFPISPRLMIQAIPKYLFMNRQITKNTYVLNESEERFIINGNIQQEKQKFRESYYPVWFLEKIGVL